MLDERGDYFDQRTGDTWDLFFPGYYVSAKSPDFERESGSQLGGRTGFRSAGRRYAESWYFNARDFNLLREHIETFSGGRWEFSGQTDLVLVNGWLEPGAEPTIDWASTISGELAEHSERGRLNLASVVERITRDLENGSEDLAYGVGEITDNPIPPESHVMRDLMLNALAGIAAALGAKTLGG
jgi:hypothetical protein